jgi:hypothetical protein
MIRKAAASFRSPMEFVMAPDPNAVTRPVTVGACHNRAQ